jgi:hypothetical protein
VKQRILPPEEWHRLKGTEAEAVWPYLYPKNTSIIVSEVGDRIIATWVLMRVVHAECIWIDPEYRGSIVWRGIMRTAREVAKGWGVGQLITGSISQYVTDLILRLGGYPVPCQSFVLPLFGRDSKRRDRELGRVFHRQLEALLPDGNHPEDQKHNEHVGRALRTAVEDKQPLRAMEEYNS